MLTSWDLTHIFALSTRHRVHSSMRWILPLSCYTSFMPAPYNMAPFTCAGRPPLDAPAGKAGSMLGSSSLHQRARVAAFLSSWCRLQPLQPSTCSMPRHATQHLIVHLPILNFPFCWAQFIKSYSSAMYDSKVLEAKLACVYSCSWSRARTDSRSR